MLLVYPSALPCSPPLSLLLFPLFPLVIIVVVVVPRHGAELKGDVVARFLRVVSHKLDEGHDPGFAA
jgi:hypothetical protein